MGRAGAGGGGNRPVPADVRRASRAVPLAGQHVIEFPPRGGADAGLLVRASPRGRPSPGLLLRRVHERTHRVRPQSLRPRRVAAGRWNQGQRRNVFRRHAHGRGLCRREKLLDSCYLRRPVANENDCEPQRAQRSRQILCNWEQFEDLRLWAWSGRETRPQQSAFNPAAPSVTLWLNHSKRR